MGSPTPTARFCPPWSVRNSQRTASAALVMRCGGAGELQDVRLSRVLRPAQRAADRGRTSASSRGRFSSREKRSQRALAGDSPRWRLSARGSSAPSGNRRPAPRSHLRILRRQAPHRPRSGRAPHRPVRLLQLGNVGPGHPKHGTCPPAPRSDPRAVWLPPLRRDHMRARVHWRAPPPKHGIWPYAPRSGARGTWRIPASVEPLQAVNGRS